MTTPRHRACCAAALLLVLGGCSDDSTPGPRTCVVAADSAALPAGAEIVVDGAEESPVSSWLALRWNGAAGLPEPEALAGSTALCCAGQAVPHDVDAVGDDLIVVNPRAALTRGASCELVFREDGGAERRSSFMVASGGDDLAIAYDRNDDTRLSPFPDDIWLVEDSETATGKRLEIPNPDRPNDVTGLLGGLINANNDLDGWSFLGHAVVPLPAAPDPASLPLTDVASVDPLATVGLFDVEEGSATFGERVPIDILIKSATNADDEEEHNLIVVPTRALTPRHEHALIVSRRAFADPSRAFGPSEFFSRVTDPEAELATTEEERLAPIATDLLERASRLSPPIRPDDVALALRFTVRSDDTVPDDLLFIRDKLQAEPPPTFTIDSVETMEPESPVHSLIRGTWQAPSWAGGPIMARDADGNPDLIGTQDIGFVMTLPKAVDNGPVPLVMYQHGSPGNAEFEIQILSDRYLSEAGYAVIGFTNIANREFIKGAASPAPFINAVFATLTNIKRLPDYVSLLDIADQLAFLRMLPEVAATDILPGGGPEIDPSAPLLYLGISQGAFQGTGLLPYAPEIGAAVLLVGGGRFFSLLMHDEMVDLYPLVRNVAENIRHDELWIGVSLTQGEYDRQDSLSHAKYLFREPHDLGVDKRASVLMIEGLNDFRVPSYSTRAAAWSFALPQVAEAAVTLPYLEQIEGPVSGNLSGGGTGAFAQFVPIDVDGIPPTPGCEEEELEDGHACPQIAPESRALFLRFLETAVAGAAVIEPIE
jgi:hypothetical protein